MLGQKNLDTEDTQQLSGILELHPELEKAINEYPGYQENFSIDLPLVNKYDANEY